MADGKKAGKFPTDRIRPLPNTGAPSHFPPSASRLIPLNFPHVKNSESEPKIYLLPNLMTAGNLFCGFLAIIQIFQAMNPPDGTGGPESTYVRNHYFTALALILIACVFDLLDGRVARIGGQESDFGREFDSLADIVSFGLAPALLVYNLVLRAEWIQDDRIGWMIAFIYLVCGAMRLARFNVISANPSGGSGTDFRGFPIPAAAGVIASLTLLMFFLEGRKDGEIGPWKYVLPPLMLLLSFMMFSNLRYPSFKKINWRTKRSPSWVLASILVLVATVIFWQVMPAVIFLLYFSYGLARPWVSRKWRREIEQEEDDDEDPDLAPAASGGNVSDKTRQESGK